MDIKRLKELSDMGVAWAQGRLGAHYVNGEDGLIPSNERGLSYLTKAALQGHKQALFDAGIMYLNGVGCDVDRDNGLHFLTEAAKLQYTDAYLHLSTFCMVEDKNYEMAYYYYLLYIGYDGEVDQETLSLLTNVIGHDKAMDLHQEVELFVSSNPKKIVMELGDYSGVFLEMVEVDGCIEQVLSTEAHFNEAILERAKKEMAQQRNC